MQSLFVDRGQEQQHDVNDESVGGLLIDVNDGFTAAGFLGSFGISPEIIASSIQFSSSLFALEQEHQDVASPAEDASTATTTSTNAAEDETAPVPADDEGHDRAPTNGGEESVQPNGACTATVTNPVEAAESGEDDDELADDTNDVVLSQQEQDATGLSANQVSTPGREMAAKLLPLVVLEKKESDEDDDEKAISPKESVGESFVAECETSPSLWAMLVLVLVVIFVSYLNSGLAKANDNESRCSMQISSEAFLVIKALQDQVGQLQDEVGQLRSLVADRFDAIENQVGTLAILVKHEA